MIVDMRVTWYKSLSAEDTAKINAERAAYGDEAKRNERMAELTATFGAADVNQDGVLDLTEFNDFLSKLASTWSARGHPVDNPDNLTPEVKEKIFAYFNA